VELYGYTLIIKKDKIKLDKYKFIVYTCIIRLRITLDHNHREGSMAKVKRQLKRNTEDGDVAVLKAISGKDDIRHTGIGIVSAYDMERDTRRREKDMEELVAKYGNKVSGIYDGTDFAKLVAEQKEMERKTELQMINVPFFAFDVSGKVKIFKAEKSITIQIDGGDSYVLGGNELAITKGELELGYDMKGCIVIERNRAIAGVAFCGEKGKDVVIFSATSKIWLGKVVPLGTKKGYKTL
jgi:hypothetical protein